MRRVAELAPVLYVTGVYTHLACADEPTSSASAHQLASFETALSEIGGDGLRPPLVHVANSAAALAIPESRRSLVRAGIAIYGISPGPGVDHLVGDLRPALSLKARVSFVKRVAAGSSISYGWRHRFEAATTVATLPLGYADGVPRRLGTLPDRLGADVLIGGRRCPIVGVVTMDQLMVDVGDADGRRRRRGRVARVTGRRTDQGRGVGRTTRHDRLRDRVRDRQANRENRVMSVSRSAVNW